MSLIFTTRRNLLFINELRRAPKTIYAKSVYLSDTETNQHAHCIAVVVLDSDAVGGSNFSLQTIIARSQIAAEAFVCVNYQKKEIVVETALQCLVSLEFAVYSFDCNPDVISIYFFRYIAHGIRAGQFLQVEMFLPCGKQPALLPFVEAAHLARSHDESTGAYSCRWVSWFNPAVTDTSQILVHLVGIAKIAPIS